MKKTKVLVVDDSAFMRSVISRLLNSDDTIEVIGTARDGKDGLSKVASLKPDVITLDIEMPNMDGLEMLGRLMETEPVPVIMVSSIARPQAEATINAFKLGAVDVVTKPSGQISLDMHIVQDELVKKVKAASSITRTRLVTRKAPLPKPEPTKVSKVSNRLSQVVIIGSSTGGPGALGRVLPALGEINAGVIVVQHMPAGFTDSLARHLNEDCTVLVKEAGSGDRLVDGLCLVAPGGKHLVFDDAMRTSVIESAPRHGVRPAVDVTLDSIPDRWCKTAVVAILTGMGMDGAAGCRRFHRLGARVIAQDESSSIVYGMPRAVKEMGLTHEVCSLNSIAPAIRSNVTTKGGFVRT